MAPRPGHQPLVPNMAPGPDPEPQVPVMVLQPQTWTSTLNFNPGCQAWTPARTSTLTPVLTQTQPCTPAPRPEPAVGKGPAAPPEKPHGHPSPTVMLSLVPGPLCTTRPWGHRRMPPTGICMAEPLSPALPINR